MLGAEEAGAAQPKRIRCSACGTEQDLAEVRESGRCVICSRPLFEAVGAVDRKAQPEPFDLGPKANANGLAAAAAVLPRQDPGHRPTRELIELLAADKRLTSLLALVPLWGPWRLRRSETHTAQEKLRLVWFSIVLTALLLVVIWMLQPSGQQLLDGTRARVDGQIAALHGLVDDYAAQHREVPDDTVWGRSAQSGDLRFYDPWGRIYRYHREEGGFTIATFGRDGVEGGRDEDADVIRRFPSVPPPEAAPVR